MFIIWPAPWAILPTRECPFCSRNKISPKSKRVSVYESFLLQNIFRQGKQSLCDFPVGMTHKNEKTESIIENENKENKNVDDFQEYKSKKKHKATWKRGMPYHKSFIDQASSVKIAGYWPCSPFAFLWTWSIKTQKENLILLTKRSVNHLYFERHCLSSSGCYKLCLIWLLITDKLHFFVCVYL